MDSNLVAALAGAVVGGMISFSGMVALKQRDDKNQKLIIRTGIVAELDNLKAELEYANKQCGHIIQAALDHGKRGLGTIYISRGADLIFINSSLEKIGLFESEVAVNIIKLISDYELLKEMMSWLNQEVPNNMRFQGQGRYEVLESMIQHNRYLISSCENIISSLKK
ncbi:hypothetical protein [Desulfopila inferna]|uniref:hypothetical protein n=1 Tax=Desulfopila inferna TaxID=468528 RepID=UPI0019664F9D|nr:hypothetical protein [Desulfopila inferna]MBM9605982.1 hypothetical protein [Desulfopila inferna]